MFYIVHCWKMVRTMVILIILRIHSTKMLQLICCLFTPNIYRSAFHQFNIKKRLVFKNCQSFLKIIFVIHWCSLSGQIVKQISSKYQSISPLNANSSHIVKIVASSNNAQLLELFKVNFKSTKIS